MPPLAVLQQGVFSCDATRVTGAVQAGLTPSLHDFTIHKLRSHPITGAPQQKNYETRRDCRWIDLFEHQDTQPGIAGPRPGEALRFILLEDVRRTCRKRPALPLPGNPD